MNASSSITTSDIVLPLFTVSLVGWIRAEFSTIGLHCMLADLNATVRRFLFCAVGDVFFCSVLVSGDDCLGGD